MRADPRYISSGMRMAAEAWIQHKLLMAWNKWQSTAVAMRAEKVSLVKGVKGWAEPHLKMSWNKWRITAHNDVYSQQVCMCAASLQLY